MQISLGITTYERPVLTITSFKDVYSDPRISDIVIVDDCSSMESYGQLTKNITEGFYNVDNKFHIYRNGANLGMSKNKAHTISLCKNDFVIIFDSDNTLSRSYIDALEAVGEFQEDTMYLPVGALPHFPYAKYSGQTIDRNNIKEYMGDPLFRCSLNTCNCLVNKEFYRTVFKEDSTIGCADTINHIYNHMVADGKLYFVPNLTYFHLVGPQSGFMERLDYNMAKAKEIENKIMQL